MDRKEFVKVVLNRVSKRSAIPMQLPVTAIDDIIDDALLWFYDNYQHAVEDSLGVLPISVFQTDYFRKTRCVDLPECVYGIYNLKEIKKGWGNSLTGDFNPEKLIVSELSLGQTMGDNLVFWTVHYSYFDLMKAYFLETVAYRFNKNTRKCRILGRDPKTDVSCVLIIKVAEEFMFDDINFRDWVVSHTLINLAEILGLYQYNLPGGVTVNYDILKSRAEARISEIKEYISQENTIDYFTFYH